MSFRAVAVGDGLVFLAHAWFGKTVLSVGERKQGVRVGKSEGDRRISTRSLVVVDTSSPCGCLYLSSLVADQRLADRLVEFGRSQHCCGTAQHSSCPSLNYKLFIFVCALRAVLQAFVSLQLTYWKSLLFIVSVNEHSSVCQPEKTHRRLALEEALMFPVPQAI
jgi:hypothetical protein